MVQPLVGDPALVLRLGLLLLLVAAGAASAHIQSLGGHAHQPGVTYTAVGLFTDGARVLYTAPAEDLRRLAASAGEQPESVLDEVMGGFELDDVVGRCAIAEAEAVAYDAIDAWQFTLLFRCGGELEALTLEYGLFADEADHVNHVEILFGPQVMPLVLTEAQREVEIPVAYLAWDRGWQLPDAPPALPGERPDLLTYLWLGFDHVLSGWDHLAFVLGVVLLVRRMAVLVGLITSFTLAHSVTLALAALEVFVLPRTLTEVLIAASIVYVGAENLWELARGRRHGLLPAAVRRRWATSFGFGLAHGFGFSFLLREIGLPPDQLVPSLALFNVGVELAQLGVVVGPFLIVQRLLRDTPAFPWLVGTLALGIVGLGGYWLIERL